MRPFMASLPSHKPAVGQFSINWLLRWVLIKSRTGRLSQCKLGCQYNYHHCFCAVNWTNPNSTFLLRYTHRFWRLDKWCRPPSLTCIAQLIASYPSFQLQPPGFAQVHKFHFQEWNRTLLVVCQHLHQTCLQLCKGNSKQMNSSWGHAISFPSCNHR